LTLHGYHLKRGMEVRVSDIVACADAHEATG